MGLGTGLWGLGTRLGNIACPVSINRDFFFLRARIDIIILRDIARSCVRARAAAIEGACVLKIKKDKDLDRPSQAKPNGDAVQQTSPGWK